MNAQLPWRDNAAPCETRRWLIHGQVQGVGYRPFVYRLARRLGITGWVRNRSGRVEILAQGAPRALADFDAALIDQAPPLARPRIIDTEAIQSRRLDEFRILASRTDTQSTVHLPPDRYICDDCLAELNDPRARRYRYPFINCTQCGPRYTIIDRLPYDRANTSMSLFPLCPRCRSEYTNPADRRFHAQPLACPECGPHVCFRQGASELHGETGLEACIAALRHGQIIAVKGIGGYHLMCDATDEHSVVRLRLRKSRPHKPLAVMVPWRGADGLQGVRHIAASDDHAAAMLRHPMRPIVLVPRRADSSLAPSIAPGLGEVGVMLPYSPLHYLLLDALDRPMVVTSGNISGEPVLADNAEAGQRLAPIAEGFLHHNRPIRRPADDPVYRIIAHEPRPLRLGRGNTPLELPLPVQLPRPVLAVGGQFKNTVALAWGSRVVLFPHIGNLDARRSQELFKLNIKEINRLYKVNPEIIACDAHPGYSATRWARDTRVPVQEVYHHHAHAAALAGEHGLTDMMLVFTWDGVGLGDDGTLWGGEALLGRPGHWRRVASMRPFALPGGDQAARQPWRTALSLCWQAGLTWSAAPPHDPLLYQAWQRGLNSPTTSAVGRLFDAAAALCGVTGESTYEGHAAMTLEAACTPDTPEGEVVALPLQRDHDGVWRSDWAPLLAMLLDGARPVSNRAACFHRSLAHTLLRQSLKIRERHTVNDIGLTGGVFQNKILTTHAKALLEKHGFNVHLPQRIPANDAGLSYGQVIEAAARAVAPAAEY